DFLVGHNKRSGVIDGIPVFLPIIGLVRTQKLIVQLGFKSTALRSGEQELFRKTINASPDQPYSETLPVPAAGVNPKALSLKLSDSQGREIIRFASAEPRDGNPRPPAIPTEMPPRVTAKNVEEIYLEGINLEKEGEDVKARETYVKALAVDPGHSRSHVAL